MSLTFHTSAGDIKVELFCDTAPRTCFNFLALVASGAYDGTLFHRNMKGFMVQGGDPTGTGKGGECIDGGTMECEFVSTLKHDRRGILSFATQGAGKQGCQFFITYARQPHLNGVYTVFGKLIDGLDTLDRLEREPVGEKNRPLKPITIEDMIIHANPIADEEAK